MALRVAKPFMRDQAENKGAYMLVIWGMRHPSWSRFAPQKDETTYSLAQKDIDSARGGRLCVSGTIAEISTEKSEAGRFYDGLMFDPLMHIFSFKAVGSSGALVEHSQARFCGAVVGKHDYANSAGGTGHAIDLVGMFDLPENKMAQETAAEPQTRPAKAPPVAPSPPVSRKITLCRDACDANYQSQSARSDCYNACDAL